MNTKKLPLAFWIFVGLVVGIVAGLALMALFTLTRTIQNLVALKDVFKKEGGAA